MHTKTCTECGADFKAARADAAYCSPACRQKAYRDRDRATHIRNAPTVTDTDCDRPVPAAGYGWSRERFWQYHTSPWNFGTEQHPNYPHPSRIDRSDGGHLEHYVFAVASIAENLLPHHPGYDPLPDSYPYAVDEPLPDALPAEITPDDANWLADWLGPALLRAAELYRLLKRRSREDWDTKTGH